MLLANGQLADQGLAELAPLISSAYYYPEHLGVELERRFALYGEIYERQPFVRSVIDKRAAALARLPVKVWWMNGDKRQLDTTSGYAKLMADPCSYLSPFDFWSWIWTTVDIYGESFLVIQKDDKGLPEQLLPMHPSRVAIKRDPQTSRWTYYFQAGSGINTELVHFDQDSVIPFKLYNPKKVERGLSRMESLRSTLFAEDSSRNATSAMWRNAGRPNLVLTHPQKLSADAQQRLKNSFQQKHAGSSNAGQTLVIEEGMDVKPVQLTAQEMQFIEARKLNRIEVCAVYDTAPTLVGDLEFATFSNISEQLRGFYRDTMAVPIALMESVFNKSVGGYWVRKNNIEFSVDDVIRGDFEIRAEAAFKMRQSGVATGNECREWIGLQRSEDPMADRLMANSALQPLGAPAEQIRLMGEITTTTPDGTPVASLTGGTPSLIPALPAPPKTEATPPQKAGNRHLRAIKGELGRGRDVKALAMQLAERYPDELDDIFEAVQLAIAERKEKQ